MRSWRELSDNPNRMSALPLCVWFLLLSSTSVSAQGSRQPAIDPEVLHPTSQRPPGPSDPAEIGAFLSGLMSAHLADHGIAGAAVAVVRNGELIFSRGYGWADVEHRIPVDPASTLFRIGSVSKLFTWTAVMQLRDEGKLELDADINRYLDFPIPPTFSEPITLRHILTHTPGFEDRSFGIFAPPSGVTRGEWLKRNIPARVRPPGRHAAYSNYGAALAGYIVEQVSGRSWEQYVETEILEPLGMGFASPRQPLPDRLARHQSRGYVHRNGEWVAARFDWVAGPLAPAGAISASAEAMAAFMIAHLENGRFGEARILEDSTAQEMRARAFGDDPRINGFGLGFYEKSSRGMRIVGHDGGTQHFFTDLVLIPSEGLGIFVAYNSSGGAHLAGRRFLAAVLDHYYPAAPLDVRTPAPGWEARAKAYSGSYLPLRRAYTTFEKPIHATMGFRVVAVGPGQITVRSPRWVMRLTELEPGYFMTSDRSLAAAFLERPGQATHMSLSVLAGMPLERQSTVAGLRFHGVVLAGTLLILMTGLVLAPTRSFVQRRVPGVAVLEGWERRLRWAAIAFSLLAIGFLISAAAALGSADRFLTGEALGALRAALLLPLLALPVAVVMVGGAAVAMRRRYWSPWGRVHYVLLTMAAVVFLVQLHFWNLLGWRF